jgi:hypothetical protein
LRYNENRNEQNRPRRACANRRAGSGASISDARELPRTYGVALGIRRAQIFHARQRKQVLSIRKETI